MARPFFGKISLNFISDEGFTNRPVRLDMRLTFFRFRRALISELPDGFLPPWPAARLSSGSWIPAGSSAPLDVQLGRKILYRQVSKGFITFIFVERKAFFLLRLVNDLIKNTVYT